MRKISTAEKEWDAAIMGENFMTPQRLEVGYMKDGGIYELSQGSGFDHRNMFGVSVLTNGKLDTERCFLFNDSNENEQERWDGASAYVAELLGLPVWWNK